MVYSTKGSDVDSTIVEGRPIMVGRKFISLDENEVYSKAEKAAAAILR
jgi:hypothetical protein